MNYVQDSMLLGQLPKRLVIGCVDSDTLNETITKIPFDFKHYKINFVALNVDGRHIPAKPLQPDFENADYIGKGNLRVEIHFDEALAGTINVVLYAEFDNVIEIGRNRQVLFDYIA